MALTPEQLQILKDDLFELKRARRSGVKRVVFGERDVTYKSDDDMRQAQRELEKEIEQEEPTIRRRSRSFVTVFRRN